MGGSIIGAPARRATLEIVYAGAGSLSGLSCCACSKGNLFRTAAAYQRYMREHYGDPEFVFSCMICEKHYGTAAGVSGHYPSCKAKAKVTAGLLLVPRRGTQQMPATQDGEHLRHLTRAMRSAHMRR